jgi:argininosuccinate lyase
MKLWQKETSPNEKIDHFTVGNDRIYDLVLAPYDCLASKAHAKMLGKIGL